MRALAQANQRVGEILTPMASERCHCRQTCVAHILFSSDPIGFTVVSPDRQPLPRKLKDKLEDALEKAEEQGRCVLTRGEITAAVIQSQLQLQMNPNATIG